MRSVLVSSVGRKAAAKQDQVRLQAINRQVVWPLFVLRLGLANIQRLREQSRGRRRYLRLSVLRHRCMKGDFNKQLCGLTGVSIVRRVRLCLGVCKLPGIMDRMPCSCVETTSHL